MSQDVRRFVGYFRMSGRQQGLLRAELEEQRTELQDFAKSKSGQILAEFVDYENGSRSAFVQLDRAMAMCKEREAILVIPRVGLLVRDWRFLTQLHLSGAVVIALDMPGLSQDKLRDMAIVAKRNDRRLPDDERLGLVRGPAAKPKRENREEPVSLQRR